MLTERRIRSLGPVFFASFLLVAFAIACVQSDPEPTADLAATVRDAVRESLPTPIIQPDISATARAVVQESMSARGVVPDAEATARAVFQSSMQEQAVVPDVEATARSVAKALLPPPVNVPNAEATALAVVQASLPVPENAPDVEAIVRAVVSEELSIAGQSMSPSVVAGSDLRAMMQNLVAVRRYNDSDTPISINEVMIHGTKFLDQSDIPSQFRLQYDNFIGLWLNNDVLATWIENNVGTKKARGVCCYYLDVREPAVYRAAILDLSALTRLISDADGLGIDPQYLAAALNAIQEGYVIVYESFTW